MEQFDRKADIFSMEIDESVKATFLEMTRWTKFMSIVGFIVISLMVLGGIIFGLIASNLSIYNNMLGGYASVVIIAYVVIAAAINFYPIYALLKYSTGMKTAMLSNDKSKFNESVAYLKNMFKYIGILMIIVLALYGLLIIIGILGAFGR